VKFDLGDVSGNMVLAGQGVSGPREFQQDDAGQEPAGQASGCGVVPNLQGIIQTSGHPGTLCRRPPSGWSPA
jgi:hypothetical protein